MISVDFDSVLLKIIQTKRGSASAQVISGGRIGSNKAVTVDRNLDLPAISAKDKKAIGIGVAGGIKHFAFSFAGSKEAVKELRKLTGKDSFIISKIESRKGLLNLDDICRVSNALLIDRGDLSREEPIDKIPFLQKLIIKKANSQKIPVYVATNLLESMVKSKKPTRAEVNDVVNTLMDGADGLVLAAETAIGHYPINCAMMVSRMIKHFQEVSGGVSLEELQRKESFLLTEPHGGILVNGMADLQDAGPLRKYKTFVVSHKVILDAEQIALGTFSPVDGFMTKREVDSVLKNFRLPSGVIWPLPIVLQVTKNQAGRFKENDTIALILEGTGDVYALLCVNDIYTCSLDKMVLDIFGTRDDKHPGVHAFKNCGNYFIAGKITLLKRLDSPFKHYEITPRQAWMIFENKGWSRVVGFHTRNVIHRAHEYIQLLAFEKYYCDGLFIHPIVGPKKKGDYHSSIILKSYELMVERYYPKGKVVLGFTIIYEDIDKKINTKDFSYDNIEEIMKNKQVLPMN